MGMNSTSKELLHYPLEGYRAETLGQSKSVAPQLLLTGLIQCLQRVTVHQQLEGRGRQDEQLVSLPHKLIRAFDEIVTTYYAN